MTDGTILNQGDFSFRKKNLFGTFEMYDKSGNTIENKYVKLFKKEGRLYGRLPSNLFGIHFFAPSIETGHFNIFEKRTSTISRGTSGEFNRSRQSSYYYNSGTDELKPMSHKNLRNLSIQHPYLSEEEHAELEKMQKKLKRRVLTKRIMLGVGGSFLLYGLITQESTENGLLIGVIGFVVTGLSSLLFRISDRTMINLLVKYNEFLE